MKHIFLLLFLLIFTLGYSQSGTIRGEIKSERSNEPAPFASVVVQSTGAGVSTDIDGKFEINNLKPGLYNLIVASVGFKQKTIFEIEVTTARVAFIDVKLQELTIEIEAAEVVGSSFSNRDESPVSVRSIGANEVKRNPGGNRDISRAIRSLPGVASTPSFRNDIIIRGGSPNENRFYIDGIEIPNINHFATQGASGGPVGLINVDFIESVDFYSGAFPANRGNALSSVLEFGFKEGRKDEYTVNAVVGSSDIGLTFEGPTGENSSLIMSARRSYLQFLFQALGLPFLPTYNDFQFKWKTKLNAKNQLTVLGLGAIDQFALNKSLADDPTSEDYLSNLFILDNLLVNSQWNYTTGVKLEHFGENGLWTFVASRNMLNNEAFKHKDNDESLPLIFNYVSQEIENKFRAEHKLYLDKGWKVNYGVAYEFAKFNNSSEFEQFSFAADTVIPISFSSAFDMHKYGAFAQVSKTMLEQRLVLSLGMRADGNEYSPEMANPLDQFSPRFSASYFITEKLSANFNTGIYYQLPAYTVLGFQENGVLANRENGVSYIRNKQLVAGFRYDIDKRNTVISVEGFWKDYDNYPFSVDKQISLANLGADFGVIGNEAVQSTGEGRAYGLEFLLQQKLYKGFYGILAYTYVRSEFADANGNYRPSSWDSRNLISFTGGKKFKKDWEIGGRFTFAGGLPYTPFNVDESVFIPNWQVARQGLPDYDRLNSIRLESFTQLDVRVDKKWFFEKWTLNLFLDIQNVLGTVAPTAPALDIERDAAGNPIEDPNRPGFYIPRNVETSSGTVLPSIGIILEL
ncbi:MAG: hypothetical protein ACJAU0_002356 [Flavobacteriales bacterium]|jgi:hypothetical protein